MNLARIMLTALEKQMCRVEVEPPPRHARYLVIREDLGPFIATPCYGLHNPWWVPLTVDVHAPGACAFDMQPTDLWMPWTDQ